ncbi:hypothetical protein jhhlp_007838 [Lomentospora prolificans]|uniref:Cation/H+ exchanger domain-containing protein n=1 Tax=Lomentospora prolificans TaxID=41688 RepID=A0A2N3N0Q4_9PEZI|nr:hypothetical protein jhhlp_007838 [Lomentospora prolificans]
MVIPLLTLISLFLFFLPFSDWRPGLIIEAELAGRDVYHRCRPSATSLVTTFVVRNSTDTGRGFTQTISTSKLGALSGSDLPNIGWIIGRPVVASAAMAVGTSLLCKYLFSPVFRWFPEPRLAKYRHALNIILVKIVLCPLIVISSYAGASVLYGSCLDVVFLTALPSTHPAGRLYETKEQGEEVDRWEGACFYRHRSCCFDSRGSGPQSRWLGSRHLVKRTWRPAAFLGMAMVACGEIGVFIIQVGLNDTSYLSQDAFITGAWAIILDTIIGTIGVRLRMGLSTKMSDGAPRERRWLTRERKAAVVRREC